MISRLEDEAGLGDQQGIVPVGVDAHPNGIDEDHR